MVEIDFNLNQRIITIQAKLDEPFQNIIDKFLQKASLQPGSVYFLANGNHISNPQNNVESLMSDLNKSNKKMQVLVIMAENSNQDNVITKSKDIICPECKEPCRIKMENYKLKLYECVNGHVRNDIKIMDFENTQKVNESLIICDICKLKNKGNCPKDGFYRCLNCKQNLCLICRSSHNLNHNIILYDQKNYVCKIHNEALIKYCKQCTKNICFACEAHEGHESIFLGELKPNIEEKKKIIKEYKINIDEINKQIKELIEQLNGFIEIINEYYEINKKIIDNYDVKRRNYQVLENIKLIDNNNNIIFSEWKNSIKIKI